MRSTSEAIGATMTTTQDTMHAEQLGKRDALADRLFRTCLDALDIAGVYLGHHLGYYAVLSKLGPSTSTEVAAATGTHERYTREWLEQQAATGVLTVENAADDPSGRTYLLEQGHAEVLLTADSLRYMVPLIRYYVAANALMPDLLDAYRAGGGIPWPRMGDEIREAQEGFNRALYLNRLGTEDLPSIPHVNARLRGEPPARVADIGTGAGWSAIAIAIAYPNVRVDGFDFDPATVERATRNAITAGVGDRVHFKVGRAEDPAASGSYALVTFFECVHDLSQPVDALRAARRLLEPDGNVIVMDERAAKEFTAPADDIDRMFYGWSILQCLPGAMAEQPSAATGAVMRPSTLRRYAKQAGYSRVDVLPLDNDPMRRWYLLTP